MKRKILVATTAAALAAGTYYAVAQGTGGSSQSPSGSGSMSQSPSTGGAGSGMQSPSQERSGTSGQGTTQTQPGTTQRGMDGAQSPQRRSTPGTTGQSPSGTQPSQRGESAPTQRSPGTAQRESGGAAGTPQLSTEQRTQIRQAIVSERNAPRVERDRLNFSVSVGTVVPRSVRVITVPETIVRIHPAWRGYRYFMVGDEIVIVEPGSLRIVAVIPA